MVAFVNRARVTYAAGAGTGPLTLSTAVPGWRSLSAAGVQDGDTVTYLITEGTDWEIGSGVYSSAGPSLSRTLKESSTGALLNVLGGGDVGIIPDAAVFRDIENRFWFFRHNGG